MAIVKLVARRGHDRRAARDRRRSAAVPLPRGRLRPAGASRAGSGRPVTIARAEVVEVAGQQKLLRWTTPGLAHAAVFWGFMVLVLTIVEGFGALFSPTFHIPVIGNWPALGFVEDLFAVLVPARRRRLHRHPVARVAHGTRTLVAVLRLTPRRGLVHPVHDRQRGVDPHARPGRPDQRRGRQQHRQPAVPARRLRLAVDRLAAGPARGRPPTRSSPPSRSCSPWACSWGSPCS